MFSQSIKLGKIFGIEIEIDYSWFIILALITFSFATQRLPLPLQHLSAGYKWIFGLSIALVLFVSVILHELAHSLVAQAKGLDISGITLFLFGGVSKMTKEPNSAAAEFQISFVGPLVSLLLAIVFYVLGVLIMPLSGIVGASAQLLGLINLMLAIFNLLPGFPLDGGRVLRAAIWHFTGSFANATRIASLVGQGFGFLMVFLGIMTFFGGGPGASFSGIWFAFIGWFLIQAAQNSYQQMVLRRMLSGVPVNTMMTTNLTSVSAEMSLEDVVNNYFLTHNYAAFPVLRDGQVVGLVSLADVRKVPREEWSRIHVGDVVQPLHPEQIIKSTDDAWEAMAKMSSEGVGRLLVMDDGILVGILTRTNLMRLIRTKMELGA